MMLARRAFLGGMIAASAAAHAERLTPADQRIDPNPSQPGSIEAITVEHFPAYRPIAPIEGPIRIWGHGNRALPWMHNLIDLWDRGLRAFHPAARLDYHMWGTSSGVPCLFNGTGDIAILGEEILPQEVAAFEHAKGYAPTGVSIMTGSLDVRNFDYAQQVFVHRANPIARMDLVQLDAIFGAEHRRGPANIRRWGEVGLKGAWADRPITPYSWAIDDSFGFYLQQALLRGSHRWNPALREYVHIIHPNGAIYDHGQQILDALARDPAGIAISNIRYLVPGVKALPIAATAAGPYVQASKASLIDQSYPLARTLPAVIDRPPDGTIDPRVREFLRFLLSREGQAGIIADGRFLPLSPAFAQTQRRIVG